MYIFSIFEDKQSTKGNPVHKHTRILYISPSDEIWYETALYRCNMLFIVNSVCQRGSDPFYMLPYNIVSQAKTSLTYSM